MGNGDMIAKETKSKLSATNKDGSAQKLETAEQKRIQTALSQLSPILQSTIVNLITRAVQAVLIDPDFEAISMEQFSQNKHRDCNKVKETGQDIRTDINREAKSLHVVLDSEGVNTQSQHWEEVLQAINAQSQRLEALHGEMKYLVLQLDTSHKQRGIAQKPNGDFASRQQRIHEPSRQSTTYIVPQRVRSPRLDRLIAFIPFLMLMAAFAISLAAAVTLAMPSLWNSMSPFFAIFIRGFFLAIAVSIIVSLVLEVSRYHRP
jgi:hypothetical protein